MLRSLYTGAMGMAVQQKRQMNASQNLANIETPSFKKEEIIAKAMEMGSKKSGNGLSSKSAGVVIDDVYMDLKQGILGETGENLDFAIEGEGFFAIQLEDGQVGYTRDGNFKVDSQGNLATMQGYEVLSKNSFTGDLAPIYIGNGEIKINDIYIADFTDKGNLQKIGKNIYTSKDNNPMDASKYQVKQGFIEKSNVNPLEEMVKMIEITRSFESNQKVIQSVDETLGKAVNEIGRI